jgi:prepilin-type N-terminal cleavage/methylation domain-containing protein
MHRSLSRTSGFTLIELIVGMLIFTIGMTGILAILHTTVQNSISSRQEIIASNLLREQVELIKNIRNTNTRNFIPFDRVRNNTTPSTFTG